MIPTAPSPTYRLPSTIQSYPERRTVRRNGVAVRLWERNVRVIWLNGKMHIWQERGRRLWWLRCDRCLTSGRGAFAVSRGWEDALQAAWRHASIQHNVQI